MSSALIRAAAARIGGDTPRLDAEVLLAHALGTERFALLAAPRDVEADAAARFDALATRRIGGEPVAYILGYRDFWTLRLAVAPAVLIPRPDSETLIEAAAEAFAGTAPRRVLDLGTGSGALLLAALDVWPHARGIGTDASAAALAVAVENARACGMAARAAFVRCDWDAGLRGGPDARFDLVLCNPPYVEDDAALAPDVRREPASALFGGRDGLDCYRVVVPRLARLLAPGGVAVVEAGARQAAAIAGLWEAGFAAMRRDLGGHARAVLFRAPAGGDGSSAGDDRPAADGKPDAPLGKALRTR